MSDKKNKLKRSRISSEESDSSSTSSSVTSSSDDETDAKDLKPIKEYMSNRKELASQLFKSVKTEKIRMMLPQILKKVEFSDLEELCANELIGMSRSRIMCIINGQEMLQSSNTEESDDLGPALEIISDTEWLSDEEINIKEGANSKNKNTKKLKKKCQEQKKQDPQPPKCKGKGKLSVQIKTEVKEKEKPKEGESLLDLLELEMRARAIRALIRKEEDSSSSKNAQINDSTKLISESKTSKNKSTKATQENLKEQLEKIDNLMNHGEDEDVFVVIQPAPTIELLSSESETDDHSERVNQKLVNERTSGSKKIKEDLSIKSKNKDNNKSSEKTINISKEKNDRKTKNENSKENDNRNENSNLLIIKADNSATNKTNNSGKLLKTIDLEEGEIIDDNDDKSVNEKTTVITETPSKRKIKRIKKNPFIRLKKKIKENNDDNAKDIKNKVSDESKSKNETNIKRKESSVKMDLIEIEESPKKENVETTLDLSDNKLNNSKIDPFDDKLLDIDEVINLDDYPDDMDELEKTEVNNERKEANKVTILTNKSTHKESSSNIPPRSETWTTRYYKQDDVQNVIKESKIQSEIRKRLRERQRQSKLNNPLKLKDQDASQQNSEPLIPKPTGSVEEYLALKGLPSETNNSTSEVARSSELHKDNNSLISSNDAVIAKNSLTKGVIENKAIEQSIGAKQKVQPTGDIVIAKTIDSTLNDNIAMEQLNKHKKSDDSLRNINAICNIVSKKSSSEKSGQNESNNFKEIICPLRITESNLISDSSVDKTFAKVDSIGLSDKKLAKDLNNKKINEEKIVSSKSKTSELRPD
ncbi:PREDICTED: MATH and LRR domain-containing protein PFE0570w [Ceratosolen solmsi marchali]|uniref:MATH and LRR domain-containing protein PFE0570w n=1 Tax=Ceratosolen solmsi marchali TaxID=326594 RepID=A0AAJ6VKT4_9HYME|nr:PREDICTED: MATH and LRR domain-containing protein PFE0570w [Ceratosolen solmsi marchali]